MSKQLLKDNTETVEPREAGPSKVIQPLLSGDSAVVQCQFSAARAPQKPSTNVNVAEVTANNTGMPDRLKNGLERLSGFDMSPVRVHYNSPQPSKVGALAYAQGSNIHLGHGQEKHLPHEAWHVVQQMQGRVKPTKLYKGMRINHHHALECEADIMGRRAFNLGYARQVSLMVAPHLNAMAPIQRVEVDLADDAWLHTWYAKDLGAKNRTVQQKYMQVLNTLMHTPDSGAHFDARLQQINWSGLARELQLLAAIMTFHMHISPFIPEANQGRDRNRQNNKRGNYLRSNEHRYRDIYRRTLEVLELVENASGVLPPINLPFVKRLQQTASDSEPIKHLEMSDDAMVVKSSAARDNFASLAILHSNYTIVQRALELIAESDVLLRVEGMAEVFTEPEITKMTKSADMTYAGTGRKIKGVEDEALAGVLNETSRLLDKRVVPEGERNFHDQLLADRGALVGGVAAAINASTGPYAAIHTEGHPNLIVNNSRQKRGRDWQSDFNDAMNQNDSAAPWKILTSIRGSFGHQRPSVAEVDHSLRFSTGFAPAETMRAEVLRSLGIKDSATDVPDMEGPRIHVEALKTAVRHAQIVIRRGAALRIPPSPILPWLQTRLIINLKKAQFLLDKYEDKDAEFDINQHYLKSMAVLENLQEYSIMYTAYTMDAQKATQTEDPYENYLKSADFIAGSDNYRIFYLDSGMQALNVSTSLARDFKKSKTMVGVNIDAYYEFASVATAQNIYTSGGRAPSRPTTDDDFIVTDLSPVITSVDKVTSLNSSKAAHFTHIRGRVKENDIVVLDITNSTLGDVSQLIRSHKTKPWAKNYIMCDSLIKLHQLGTDKFIQGRMIVVGTAEFLHMAEQVVGPIAQEARNDLANAVRANLDQAIYGNTVVSLSDHWLKDFSASAGKYNPFMQLMGFTEVWATVTGESGMTLESDVTEVDPVEGWQLLNAAFNEYVNYAASGAKADPKYEAAFKLLPLSDQHELMHRVMRIIAPRDSEVAPAWVLTGVTQSGIENVGNTCYLAAGLNMLAFSPYAVIFPVPGLLLGGVDALTPRERLRRAMGEILDRIRGGVAVGADLIEPLLELLNQLGLLPQPSAAASARGAQATRSQQDPNEVFFRKILAYFSADMAATQLGRAYRTQIDSPATDAPVLGLDATQYSALGDDNILLEPPQSDTVLELATAGVADLRQAMARYLAEQVIPDVKYRSGVDEVRQGAARRRIILGDQQPTVITLALVRWAGLAKDTRAIDMPEYFVLNNIVYRLDTVVYHHGATPDSGHYTASNRVPGTANWQYRDDSAVGNDAHFNERKGRGYLFAYTGLGYATHEHAGLLNLNNPGVAAEVDMLAVEPEVAVSSVALTERERRSNYTVKRYIQAIDSVASWNEDAWLDFKHNCINFLVGMKAWRQLLRVQMALEPYCGTVINVEIYIKEIEFQWRQAGSPPID